MQLPCLASPGRFRKGNSSGIWRLKQVLYKPSASGDCYQPLSAMQHDSLACTVAPLRDCLGSSLISGTTGFNFIIKFYRDTRTSSHVYYQCISFFVHALTTHVRVLTFQWLATEERDDNRQMYSHGESLLKCYVFIPTSPCRSFSYIHDLNLEGLF